MYSLCTINGKCVAGLQTAMLYNAFFRLYFCLKTTLLAEKLLAGQRFMYTGFKLILYF